MSEMPSLKAIGWVHAARTEPIDDGWDSVPATLELDTTQFEPSALAGIDSFSHIEVLFAFHRASDAAIVTGARHPRGRPDWPAVGIFAQRAKARPNRIGATICTLLRVENLILTVRGLDAIDGTPILDIKPVMRSFLPRGDFREPDWVPSLMEKYW